MEKLEHILIVSITPYFLEKEFSWFEENLTQILKAQKTQSFWQDNTLFLQKEQKINMSEVLRKLDEMGYEKVFKIEQPGDFSLLGGIIDIFPVNTPFAIRLDFLGSKIEHIEKLPLQIADETSAKALLKKRLKSQKIFSDLKGLKQGDYLTHLDHGIGRFVGIEQSLKFKTQNAKLNYYVLEYANGDKLYVPFGLERKLTRYIGFAEPKLSRLGSNLWQKTKYKIKEEAEAFAKELLTMFSQKEIAQRPPYVKRELYETLQTSFPYALTADQAQCLKEIENDFAKEKPADRVICGDVGFGKTEVALRACVLAAENNRQAVVMCPTTVLASQHFQTFQKRLARLPVKIALLSRLQNMSEKKKIYDALQKGTIDILIATHSVLNKNIRFHNLGLLVIDDEQKFGVKQKEILRAQNPALDVLYLSATPIPRTLYMALSSLKQISFIHTPPEGRKPIQTFILPFQKEVIKNALKKELARDGQIYFLHNRVQTILSFKKFLQDLLGDYPKAHIGILHAKMSEKEIIKTLNDFQNGKINLLLATTIIENGLDISNANTFIVDNATKLGLAQAYQLRGRIGRSDKQSFAYFLYPRGTLKGLAKKRLAALKQAQELGAGYRIAQTDLEIRGAGNILGKEQSGNINKIGLNLYCQMLSEAIEKIKRSQA